tara:strand:+ start:42 stop:569 length:528 start_codon:yes stop_codon:yes gene_type:complete
MNKLFIIVLVLMCLSLAKEEIKLNNQNIGKWETSVSYGFLSEKTPVSIIEFSRLLNISKQSDFYISFGSMLFASGVGLGYKYYLRNKDSNSMFVNFGSHLAHLGTADDQGMRIYGINISPGYTIVKSNLDNKYVVDKYGREWEFEKSLTNIGVSFMYMGDNSIGAFPFISFEKRF